MITSEGVSLVPPCPTAKRWSGIRSDGMFTYQSDCSVANYCILILRLGRSKDQTQKNFALNTIACKILGYHRAASYQAQFNHAKNMLKWAQKQDFAYDVAWW